MYFLYWTVVFLQTFAIAKKKKKKTWSGFYKRKDVSTADDICEVFESLQDVIPPELEELTNYFEDMWIGRPFRRRRRDAVFKPELWTTFDWVQGDLPKTNNSLEGWHRSLQLTLGYITTQPFISLWSF